MKFRTKVTAAILVTFILFIILFYIISSALLKRAVPEYEGEIKIKNISSDIKIYRDNYAVPYIYAESDEDAAFALGYCHAQERLYQMDMLRRAGEGRLSEVLGSKAIAIDKMFRTLGLFNSVKENYPKLCDNSKRILEAYSKGVNEFITHAGGKFPIEFAILGYEPALWKPENSLVIAKLLAWELNISWWTDIAYTHIIQKFGEEKAKEIMPDYPQNAPVIVPSGIKKYAEIPDDMIKTDQEFRKLIGFSGTHIGSNSWVVNGNMSKSGKPVIANDTHLAFQAPGYWYVAVLRCTGLNVEGFTIPGLPAVVIGRNQNIAWGLTNVMADDSDFYIEKLDDSKTKYLFDGQYRDLQIQKDSIIVKDSATVFYEIKKTHRGPIISDVHSNTFMLNTSSIPKVVLSMRWTALEFSDELKGILALDKARNWDEFKSALKDFTVPGQNFVYADFSGNIGYVCAAKLPIRPNNSPSFVYDGTTSANDWKGYVPYDDMPKLYNPAENFIATANNKTVKDFRYHISNLWEPSSRIERINQLLKSVQFHSKEDFKKYQMDIYSPYAKEITAYIMSAFKNIKITDANLSTALNLLSKWDYQMNPQSQTPSIYAFFLQHLMRNIFKDEMGEQLFNEFVFMANIPYRVIEKMLSENKSSWFDDAGTPEVEDREVMIRKSLADALTDLEKLYSSDMQKWQWGEIHKLTIKHQFHGQSKLFDRFSDIGEISIGGDGTTIFNTEYSFVKPYDVTLGPSMRYVFDFSLPDEFEFVLPAGQSGYFMSPHYKDMTKLYLSGQMVKISLKNEDIVKYKLLNLKRD